MKAGGVEMVKLEQLAFLDVKLTSAGVELGVGYLR